jgi:TM2 domain-containing membrane protein YozV
MKRSPAAALFLSLIPGAGHVYVGQPSKGLILILSFASAIYLSAEGAGAFFGIMIAFVLVYSMIDAHRTAVALNHLVDTGQSPVAASEAFAPSQWWGWALIVVGVVFTLDNFGWFGFELDWIINLWPFGLIALGIYFLKKPSLPAATTATTSAPAEADADSARSENG